MKLNELFSSDQFKCTVYGERFLNNTKGSFKDYSDVDEKYDPQGSIENIDLPYTMLPRSGCTVLESNPDPVIKNWVIDGNYVRFFWHPDVIREGFTVSGIVSAQPTGSTRTLLTESMPRVYIKTDLDKKHFRFVRRLQRSSVEHSIAICRDLREFSASLSPGSTYSFLPESIGIVTDVGIHRDSGVIFREANPWPHSNEQRVIMPYHSLYASDPRDEADAPLAIQLIDLHGSSHVVDYFVSHIVAPLLDTWVLLVSNRGILPELHGQNTLAEIDRNMRITRIVHRDFQGTYSDPRIRSRLGLQCFSKHLVGQEEGTTIQSQYSHVFDGMIGRYLIGRLTKAFCEHFGKPYQEVCEAIRAYHRNIVGWDTADYPETTYRFASSAREQRGNDVRFIDSGEAPEFR